MSTKSTITVSTLCPVCNNYHDITLPAEGYYRWEAGELAQTALADVEPQVREQLISGVCPACWHKMFKPHKSRLRHGYPPVRASVRFVQTFERRPKKDGDYLVLCQSYDRPYMTVVSYCKSIDRFNATPENPHTAIFPIAWSHLTPFTYCMKEVLDQMHYIDKEELYNEQNANS